MHTRYPAAILTLGFVAGTQSILESLSSRSHSTHATENVRLDNLAVLAYVPSNSALVNIVNHSFVLANPVTTAPLTGVTSSTSTAFWTVFVQFASPGEETKNFTDEQLCTSVTTTARTFLMCTSSFTRIGIEGIHKPP